MSGSVPEPTHQGALVRGLRAIERALAAAEGGFPHTTENGEWVWTTRGSWTGGFWIALLWLAHALTRKMHFADAAIALLHRLEARIDAEDADFDLGFLFYPGAALGYQITGNNTLRDIGMRAVDRMLSFMHSKAKLIYCIYPHRSEQIFTDKR